jgi:hypothetical protein
LEPHLLIELDCGDHSWKRVDPNALKPEFARAVEKRAGEAGSESRPSMIGPDVNPPNLPDRRCELS